jgi:hypothetical protein
MSKYIRSRSERKHLKRMARKYAKKAKKAAWRALLGDFDEPCKEILRECAGLYKRGVDRINLNIKAEK